MKTFNKKSIFTALAATCALGLTGWVLAATTVSLGTADNFAVLAGSGVTDSNPSVVSGDVGVSPGGGATIGIPAAEVTGTIYAVDGLGPVGSVNNPGLVNAAKSALVTAYLDAAGQVPATPVGDLGGQTLTPGVYEDDNAPDSMAISSGTKILTLNGLGDPNAVFVFKSGSTLVTAAGSEVKLINGVQPCNVFWQVTSSATLGVGSIFKGNILALTSITDNGSSIVEGRLLARNGAVTLNNTTVTKATCAVPPPPPAPSGGSGGSAFMPLPLINVTKIPNPLALPGGPGQVTYTYTATNLGVVAMSGVWVKDNKCSPVQFVSGDTDNDSMLDVSESWVYRCTKTVSQTETNTATARGWSNGWDGYDTANATVVVGTQLTPPLIHLVKVPSAFLLSAGGGAVTYRYTVTNPGVAPLSDVSITDDKCTGLPGRVVGHPGDLNKNNLLESNEVWSFTCQTNITKTTTNIGTAEGQANGLTAIDFSSATVVVATPGFPNTGLPPEAEKTSNGIAQQAVRNDQNDDKDNVSTSTGRENGDDGEESLDVSADNRDVDDADENDELENISEHLDKIGKENRELTKKLSEIALEQRVTKDEIKQSIGEIKDRSGWRVFLIGPDFKNLGDLRSTIVTIDNHIQKLNSMKASTTPQVKAEIEVEISALQVEKTRIEAIMQDESSRFSLFGWFTKWFQ